MIYPFFIVMFLVYNNIMKRFGIFGGAWGFIVFLILFSDLLPLVIFPLLFVGITVGSIVLIVKAIKSASIKKEKVTNFNNRPDSYAYSNADMARIDEKLSSYFDNNISLPIIDNISLETASGKYTSLGNLFVTYGSEKILKLSEFAKAYPSEHDKILKLLALFSQKVESNKNTHNNSKSTKKSQADNYIDKINELNDAIPHEEISNGLDQACQLLKQIDLATKGNNNEKIDKLYDFYLPTLVTILNKYRQLNDSPIHGDEFDECENQLMKTIILINQAMKTICNSIHEYEYMDLNADISTLQTILKKDGLLDDDPFAGKKNG